MYKLGDDGRKRGRTLQRHCVRHGRITPDCGFLPRLEEENPYEVIVSNNLYEQQDYVVETNHLPHLISLIVNDEFFKDLPEDEQEIMTEAAQLATEYAREQSDARIADKIATIKESGTEIITLSDETRKEIREASKGVYESIREVIDPKIYDSYMDGIEE